LPNDAEHSAGALPVVDRLIHEPARYNIMALLYVVERAEYLFVLNQTRMTAGNLTAHASKLESAGYLAVQKKFVGKKPKTFFNLTYLGRQAFEAYRREMTRLLNEPPNLGDTQAKPIDQNPDESGADR
jgi:DNA-binding MarR family transcriptional regulator